MIDVSVWALVHPPSSENRNLTQYPCFQFFSNPVPSCSASFFSPISVAPPRQGLSCESRSQYCSNRHTWATPYRPCSTGNSRGSNTVWNALKDLELNRRATWLRYRATACGGLPSCLSNTPENREGRKCQWCGSCSSLFPARIMQWDRSISAF